MTHGITVNDVSHRVNCLSQLQSMSTLEIRFSVIRPDMRIIKQIYYYILKKKDSGQFWGKKPFASPRFYEPPIVCNTGIQLETN